MSTFIVVEADIEVATDNLWFLEWSRTRRVYTGGSEAHIDKRLLIWYASCHNNQATATMDSNGQAWRGSVKDDWYIGTDRQRIVIQTTVVTVVVAPGIIIGSDEADFREWSRTRQVYTGDMLATIDKQLLIWYSTLHGQARAQWDSQWNPWSASVQGSWYTGTKRQRIVIKSHSCAVLLLTGALNPVHNGHVDMFKFALSEIHGIYDCIRPILSPSHDEYVSSKGDARPFADRLKLAQAVDGVEVSEWEGQQKHFVDYKDVLEHFEGTEKADVFYIVGDDHYKANVKSTMQDKNVIVVPRGPQDVSSTLVRSVSDVTRLRSMVPPRVADLIISSNLYGFSETLDLYYNIEIYSYNIQYDGNLQNHIAIVQSLIDNLHLYSVICLQEVPVQVWNMLSRKNISTHAWMYKDGELLGVDRRLQPVFQDAFFPKDVGTTKYSVNQRPFLCATIQHRKNVIVVGTAHVWSIFGELGHTTNRVDIDLKMLFLEQCFTYMDGRAPGATLLFAGDTNLVDEPWTREYEDRKIRSLGLMDMDSQARVRTWDGTTNSNVPSPGELHRPDRVFMRGPRLSTRPSTLVVHSLDMRSDHFPIVASVPIDNNPDTEQWDPQAATQMAIMLRACYNKGFEFPAWTLRNISDQEDLFRATHVYYGDSTSTRPELALIQQLVREREPVNIEMKRSYSQARLDHGFGHQKGFYGSLADARGKLPPSIAVYTKTLVGSPESHVIVHLLHAIGLGFDVNAQPDLQLFLDGKIDCVAFYRYMFKLIFTCADDKLGPDSTVVLSLVGGNNFANLYPGGRRKLWSDVWIPALMSHLQEFPHHVPRLRGMGFPPEFLTLVDPVIRNKLQGDRLFPDIVADYDLTRTLFVNAWDPWSVVGNGNERDESLDGHIGRNSNAAILSTSMTNTFLDSSENYTFVKESVDS